jgi:DNA-directed RNA polymerase specialized sigma24 family protein
MPGITETLSPHLPYLRRYARALTGSQSEGDAFVRAALTAFLEGIAKLNEDVPPRVALYQLFHSVWLPHAAPADKTAKKGSPNCPNERLTVGELYHSDHLAKAMLLFLDQAKDSLSALWVNLPASFGWLKTLYEIIARK